MKNKGFTLTELMMVLVVGSAATVLGVSYYYDIAGKSERQVEAKHLVSYSKAVAAFVRTNQALIYNTNAQINISQDQLIKYNIIGKNEYGTVKDPKTGDVLYPCAVIFKSEDKGKLQGFVYYRTDGTKMNSMSYDDSQKTVSRLMMSLKTLGNSGSVLAKTKDGGYGATGANGGWSLNKAQVDQYLTKTGYDFLSDGLNSCKGSNIATPSYTISLNSFLDNINGSLNAETSIKQNINEIIISNNNPTNSMTDLDMDSNSKSLKGVGQENNGENKLMFQSNPNCVMNPSQLSTMQDYSPTNNKTLAGYSCNLITDKNGEDYCSNISQPNIFGCRNKQLAIGGQNLSISVGGSSQKLTAVTVNGFESVDTSFATGNSIDKGSVKRLTTDFLGGINADSVQATAQIQYAANCDISEIGSMATQKKDIGNDYLAQIHNLNQSLLVCQKSLLCDQSSGSINPANVQSCWLPISTTTVTLNFSINDKILALQAPSGFYIKPGSVVYTPRAGRDKGVQLNSIGTVGVQHNFQNGNDGGHLEYGVDSWCHDKEGKWMQEYTENGSFSNPKNYNGSLDKVYAQSSLLDQRIKTTFNNITIWRENDSLYSFDVSNYWTSGGSWRGGSSFAAQSGTQATNWSQRNQDLTYKFGSSVPYIASSLWDLRQARYDNDNGYNQSGCIGWRQGTIVAFPYYITRVTLSNDVDVMPIDSNNPPPAPTPPIPTGQCGSSNIPQDIITTGTALSQSYNRDLSTGESVVLASPSNLVFRSENVNPTNNTGCKVTASAKYCPAQSATCLSYRSYSNHGNCAQGLNVINCNVPSQIHTPGCADSGGRWYACGGCSTGGDPMDHNACWGQVCTAYQPAEGCANPKQIDFYTAGYSF